MALLDEFILHLDRALKTLTGEHTALREYPATDMVDSIMNEDEARHAAGLMRVNHTGEICAQALYEGQALTASKDDVRRSLKQAADEESDHLAWCEQRLSELGSKPSVLNPLFYAASYALRKDLGVYSPYLADLRLVDYKVRILSPKEGTGAVTRVMIESADGEGVAWSTVGVSPNIIDASFNALLDSIVYKLLRDGAPS